MVCGCAGLSLLAALPTHLMYVCRLSCEIGHAGVDDHSTQAAGDAGRSEFVAGLSSGGGCGS